MNSIKRRHFLQFAGSTLAAIGLSQLDFRQQAEQYGRVLAQGTPRKLALLVGINSYLSPVPSLQGCKNDVLLQRELLVHRFGFNPADIMILTDAEATREAILAAFTNHLIAQAKPGDVVVFHYSGHGSLVQDPNPLRTPDCQQAQNCNLNGTLVAADAPTQTGDLLVLPQIMGRSLFFLRNAIQTENLTLVLDSCYSGAGTRGNVQVRSAEARLANGDQPPAPELELAYQQDWLARLNLMPDQFQQQRQANRVNGVAIGSASRNQEALDMPFGGFHAGAFTYLMTRYLWQAAGNESFGTVRTNLIRSTEAITTAERKPQIPVFELPPNRSAAQQPVYFLPAAAANADAVVTKVTADQIEFWLGGVSTQNLASAQTVFLLLDASGQPVLDGQSKPIEIQQESRVAPLFGYAKTQPGHETLVRPGMLLREKIVGLDANPVLKVGLDVSLGAELTTARTELEQALVSAQGVSRVQPVEQQGQMDYLLARTTAAYQEELSRRGETELPPLDSLALFNSDRTAVVPGSYGQPGEAVTDAVMRLKPKLKLLLASQVLRAITATDSDLLVSGEVFSSTARVPLINRRTESAPVRVSPTLPQFRAGEEIQIKVASQEPESVYLSCLAIDAAGNLIVLYPVDWNAPEESARIDPEGSMVVPQGDTVFKVSGAGRIELLTLVSTEPLRLALKGLSTVARGRGISRGFVGTDENEALDAVGDLLGDFDSISRGTTATIVSGTRDPDQRIRSTNTLAAFSTIVEIVE